MPQRQIIIQAANAFEPLALAQPCGRVRRCLIRLPAPGVILGPSAYRRVRHHHPTTGQPVAPRGPWRGVASTEEPSKRVPVSTIPTGREGKTGERLFQSERRDLRKPARVVRGDKHQIVESHGEGSHLYDVSSNELGVIAKSRSSENEPPR